MARVKKKTKYTKFDPVDELRSERAFEVYIQALIEDGASEKLMQSAYRDVERARVVHGIPKPEAPTSAATPAVGVRHAATVA